MAKNRLGVCVKFLRVRARLRELEGRAGLGL